MQDTLLGRVAGTELRSNSQALIIVLNAGATARTSSSLNASLSNLVAPLLADSSADASLRARVATHEAAAVALASPEANSQDETRGGIGNATSPAPVMVPAATAAQPATPVTIEAQSNAAAMQTWGLLCHEESAPAAGNILAEADRGSTEAGEGYRAALVDAAFDLFRGATKVLAPEPVQMLANLPLDLDAIDAAMENLLADLTTFDSGLAGWLGQRSPATWGMAAASAALFAIGGRQVYSVRRRRDRLDEVEQDSLCRLFARVHGFGADR